MAYATVECDPFRLIELIYDAVERTDRWPIFMEAVCRALGGTRGILALQVPGKQYLRIGCLHGWTQQDLIEYGERYQHLDPWIMSGDRFPDGSVGDSLMLCSQEEFDRSVAAREFYAPRNIHHGCGVVIYRNEDGMSFLTLQRSKDMPYVSEQELEVLRRLVPHLQRAVRLHGELSSLRSQLASVRHVMDLYPQGFFQTDANCRVIYANETARSNEMVTVESGQLQVGSARDHRTLREAVHKMTSETHGRMRRLDLAPYRLLLIPIRKFDDPTFDDNQPAVSILMVDRKSASNPDPAMLGALFSLTPAEAKFTSSLVSGYSVDDIAAQLSITRETARTHLRRVLGKTNTRRQGELISLVLRSIPFARG